jgi:hypothetical protein
VDLKISSMSESLFPSRKCFYTIGPFANKNFRDFLVERVKDFNNDLPKTLQTIMANGKKYRTYDGLSKIAGLGAFSTESIKSGVKILAVPGTIKDPNTPFDDRRFCYETTINFRGKPVQIVIDGKEAVEKMNKIPVHMMSADEDDLDRVNASRHNHKCLGYNMRADWEMDEKSGIPFLVYTTTKYVGPNEELTSNYNDGYIPDNTVPFFSPISKLEKEGCPIQYIQECKCSRDPYSFNSQKCPKMHGYDKRVMFPSAYEDLAASERASKRRRRS